MSWFKKIANHIPVYRGTDQAGSQGLKITPGGVYGDGIYFYTNPHKAKNHATWPGGSVMTAYIDTADPNVEIFNDVVVVRDLDSVEIRGQIPLEDTSLSGQDWEDRVARASKLALANDFEDMFGDITPRQEVKRYPPQTEYIVLTLHRGFDADLEKMERQGNDFIFRPEKCEQGVIWFSQNEEDAQGRGQYLMTYPLVAKRHYERVWYEDEDFLGRKYYDDIPEEIREKTNPYENCRFHAGIELPEGWYFSYKVQKHIVCDTPIKVSPDMIDVQRELE